jgi:hypothetical protein
LLQIIAQKINPNADLSDVRQLKEIVHLLDTVDLVKREPGMESPEEERTETPINLEHEEGMDGVVAGVGTLMLDPLGRES